MKKTDYSHRPNREGSNNARRNQTRFNRPNGPNGAPQNRSQSQNNNAQAVRLWMSPPSQTLTSHIPMINKRKQDAYPKKAESANGSNSYDHRNKGKQRYPYDKSRQDANGSHAAHRNKPVHKPRDPQEALREEAVDNQVPAEQQGQSMKELGVNIDAFQLFCAYHLGIGPNKEFKPSNINEVSKRFGTNPAILRQAMKEFGMDPSALLDRDFDMALAQLDIQVAPEGIDRLELAKGIYEDFLKAPLRKRDWKKILEEDRKENVKVFGKN